MGVIVKSSILVAFALCADIALCASPAAPRYDAGTIIRRSVEANAEDWKAAPQFDYFERDREENGETRTYEVIMILGSRYERLVAVNGKPLTAEQQAQEEQKLKAAIAERKKESPQEREKRVANYKEERERDHLLMQEMTKAFDFKVVEESRLGNHQVYVLEATPRQGYNPPDNKAKVLTGMRGKLWIDKQTFQWVKVEAHVIQPVSIAGFLARVEPGTRFELEKMPVAAGIWLPSHFAMKAKAKELLVFTHHEHEEETYYGYHRSATGNASGY